MNEASGRKTSNLVLIHDGERLLNSEAETKVRAADVQPCLTPCSP